MIAETGKGVKKSSVKRQFRHDASAENSLEEYFEDSTGQVKLKVQSSRQGEFEGPKFI